MQRLLWPLGVVAAFALGVMAPRSVEDEEVTRLKAALNRLEAKASSLQARLSASEAARPSTRPTAGLASTAIYTPATVDKRPQDPGAASADGSGRGRRSRRGTPQGEPQDDLSSGRSATGPRKPAPTVDAALDRFSKYLDAINASGPGRWQQVRDQTNELRAMGDTGTKALMKVLADSSSSSDDRRAAAQLLGQFQAADALPLLQNILANDEDVLLRRAAAAALRRMDMPETIPAMQALLVNPDEDRFVRMSAAFGLAQQGSPLGITGLEQIFQEADADGRGRDLAFRALASLQDPEALPFMRQLATTPDAELNYRLQAIRFLGALNDVQALGPLQMIMRSPTEQPSIRDAAALAYAAISGR